MANLVSKKLMSASANRLHVRQGTSSVCSTGLSQTLPRQRSTPSMTLAVPPNEGSFDSKWLAQFANTVGFTSSISLWDRINVISSWLSNTEPAYGRGQYQTRIYEPVLSCFITCPNCLATSSQVLCGGA